MAYFGKCPECGETNHYQSASYSDRHFDCGFRCDFQGNRVERCGSKRQPRAATANTTSDDSAARYRLALLDAAQVVDTIAGDLRAEGQRQEHVQRLQDLALQMRTFAGHSGNGGSFDDLAAQTKSAPAKSLMAIFKRATRGRGQE